MRRLVVVLIAAACLPAGIGHAATKLDANDVSSPLDIKRVTFDNVGSDNARLRFSITTYDGWTVKMCRRAAQMEDGCVLAFTLDTKGAPGNRASGNGVDYRIVWGSNHCNVIDAESTDLVTRARSLKHGPVATCVVQRSEIDVRRKIRWYAHTTWAAPSTGDYTTDHAPGSGWYG